MIDVQKNALLNVKKAWTWFRRMSLEEQVNGEYHKGKHDQIVKTVVKRLEDSGLYNTIKHCVNYHLKKSNRFGEADVLARSGERYFAFEIKSTERGKVKAYLQLLKDSVFLRREGAKQQIYLYHVYGVKDGSITYKRIRGRK